LGELIHFNRVNRRRFISFEGPEACGKSTQIERLQKNLLARGEKVLLTREPGGTPLGELIRHLLKHAPEGSSATPEAQLLLFAASRAQIVRTVIKPFLDEGGWVLCDRFCDSTVVFQGVAGGLGDETVSKVNQVAMGDCLPGLTLLLDIPVEESFRRLKNRPRPLGVVDHFDDQSVSYFEKVRAGYLELAERERDRICRLDGLLPAEAVEKNIWERVSHAFSIE
jgi:dTMP kinase